MKKGKKVSLSRSKSKSKKTPQTKRSIAINTAKPQETKVLQPNVSMIQSAQGFFSVPNTQDHKKQHESLAVVLDDYETILNSKLKSLKGKWGEVQVLQKTLAQSVQTCKDENLLQIQNNFYINKITQLQEALRIKEKEIKQLRLKNVKQRCEKQKSVPDADLIDDNRRLKQENQLLQRQNRVLKQKLKEAGLL